MKNLLAMVALSIMMYACKGVYTCPTYMKNNKQTRDVSASNQTAKVILN